MANNQTLIEPEKNSNTNTTKTTKSNKTIETYTNTRYRYSVQYPSNWFIDGTESAENDFRLIDIGGDLNFSDTKPKKNDFRVGISPSLGFYIYKDTEETTIEKYISKYNNFNYKGMKRLNINGNDAVELVNGNFNQPHTIIQGDNTLYIFTYNGYVIPEGHESIYQQIINSFTITK